MALHRSAAIAAVDTSARDTQTLLDHNADTTVRFHHVVSDRACRRTKADLANMLRWILAAHRVDPQ